MNKEKVFKQVEKKVKDLSQGQFKIIDSNGIEVNSVFTTSEEEDINEMINNGFTVDEIVIEIIKWNNRIYDIFNSKRN